MNSWDEYYLGIAALAASKSRDPSTKVGCVLVDSENRIVSVGFNGFARGCSDDPKLYADRPEKYRRILHAECNALLFADRKAFVAYVTHPPCSQCMAMLIQHGVQQVVYRFQAMGQHWESQRETVEAMCKEANVYLTPVYTMEDIAQLERRINSDGTKE